MLSYVPLPHYRETHRFYREVTAKRRQTNFAMCFTYCCVSMARNQTLCNFPSLWADGRRWRRRKGQKDHWVYSRAFFFWDRSFDRLIERSVQRYIDGHRPTPSMIFVVQLDQEEEEQERRPRREATKTRQTRSVFREVSPFFTSQERRQHQTCTRKSLELLSSHFQQR